VSGCRFKGADPRGYARGLIIPKSVTAATARYFDEQEVFGLWIAERCDPGAGCKSCPRVIPATSVYYKILRRQYWPRIPQRPGSAAPGQEAVKAGSGFSARRGGVTVGHLAGKLG
jgi:hypothetical protein